MNCTPLTLRPAHSALPNQTSLRGCKAWSVNLTCSSFTVVTRHYPHQAGTEFYAYATAALKATARLRAHLHPDNARPQAIISTLLFNYLTSYRHVLSLQDYQYQLLSSTAIHTLTNTRVATVITYAQFQQPDYQPGPLHYLPAMFLRAPSATPSLPLLINSDQQCPFRARSLHFAAHHPVTTQAIDSWAAIINLVRAGQGVALLPAYLTQDDTLTRIPGTPGYRVPYRTYTRQ